MTNLSNNNNNTSLNNDNFTVHFDNQIKEVDYLQNFIENSNTSEVKGITLFLGSDYMGDLSPLDHYLKTIDIPISGAIFPEIIYDNKFYKDAAIIIAWKSDIKVKTFNDISNHKSELYDEAIPAEETTQNDNSSCLIFVDSRTGSAEEALDALYYRSNNEYQYAGVGAGYLGDEQLPCIISNDGIAGDALQTVRLSIKQKNKVTYGWTPISGPHLVTSSTKNKVSTLDYLPMAEQYRNLIAKNVTEDITELSLNDLFAKYPLGIHHYGEDMIVRDPYGFEEGTIEFFGEVPEFSNVYILSGEADQLIKDVEISLQQFVKETQEENSLSILFTCIGRRGLMGDKSDDELNVISNTLNSKQPIIGTSSFGEIATNQEGLVRFHALSHVLSKVY
ncbi:MAG: hypothetical protein ACI88H_003568 [Cocleimonas sp.]|jgi:hypothetical protein